VVLFQDLFGVLDDVVFDAPPETDPTNSPSSAMAIFAPGRRGAEP